MSKKNLKRTLKMSTEPKPDFAAVLTEGVTKTGGLVDNLEIIGLSDDKICTCEEKCSCKKKINTSKCLCAGYVGQNYHCPEHIAKTECPNCKSIGVEKELHYETSMIDYSCTICGFFYARRVSDGEYQFS